MFRRRLDDDDLEPQRPRVRDRSLSTRLAWCVLVLGAATVVVRASVATVVQVHGDGMAPTIMDGDHVLVVRGRWTVEQGDIVLYDPRPPPPPTSPPEHDAPRHPDGIRHDVAFPDARRDPQGQLRNTAVVDMAELEDGWRQVQDRSDPVERAVGPPPTLRVGRVLARPGDTVEFNVPDAALGLAIDGVPLEQKPAAPLRLLLSEQTPGSETGAPQMHATAFEVLPDQRYQVLCNLQGPRPRWDRLDLPAASEGPAEVRADGYLIVADNREAGACCDSRALGWIPATHLEGEVMARVAGNPNAAPDLDPDARSPTWLP